VQIGGPQSRLAQAKARPYFKITTAKKGWRPAWQIGSPQFKLKYCPKQSNKQKTTTKNPNMIILYY
jgi:hypothetical protein